MVHNNVPRLRSACASALPSLMQLERCRLWTSQVRLTGRNARTLADRAQQLRLWAAFPCHRQLRSVKHIEAPKSQAPAGAAALRKPARASFRQQDLQEEEPADAVESSSRSPALWAGHLQNARFECNGCRSLHIRLSVLAQLDLDQELQQPDIPALAVRNVRSPHALGIQKRVAPNASSNSDGNPHVVRAGEATWWPNEVCVLCSHAFSGSGFMCRGLTPWAARRPVQKVAKELEDVLWAVWMIFSHLVAFLRYGASILGQSLPLKQVLR